MEKQTKIIVTLVTTLVVMIIGWTGFRLYSGKLIIQAGASQNEYRNARKVYQKKVTKLSEDVYTTGAGSKNAKIKSVSLLNNSNQILKLRAQEFFKGYYNFKNVSQYMSRVDLLLPLMTDDVKNNDSLFDKKDSAGEKTVQSLGLQSSFQNVNVSVESASNDEIKGLIDVQYTAVYKGDNKGFGIRTYEVTYNKKQAKFTQIDLQATGIQNDTY